ncbi:MAG: PTS glucose transporter subunit IIA [Deltaproteobacteria bacterium]|jgi:glucose-specific phosphotransferase system IIA component|nr:PTS glucose transporter subunit IIA [Deltaproteobacteria bacterium]
MFFGKKKNTVLLAPLSGRVATLDEVPDPVFSDRIIGDGAAIWPESNLLLAPAAGVVSNLADTYHAYGITTVDGLEVLIHIGIDTVKLLGQGFKPLVKEGQKIKPGTPLAQIDLEAVKASGYAIWTPVIITNLEQIASMSVQTGTAEAGKTTIVKYEKK